MTLQRSTLNENCPRPDYKHSNCSTSNINEASTMQAATQLRQISIAKRFVKNNNGQTNRTRNDSRQFILLSDNSSNSTAHTLLHSCVYLNGLLSTADSQLPFKCSSSSAPSVSSNLNCPLSNPSTHCQLHDLNCPWTIHKLTRP